MHPLRCSVHPLQDVYTIKFSPYFEGILNSCGTGHIRFWKMASTFTGLKLQVRCAISTLPHTHTLLNLHTLIHACLHTLTLEGQLGKFGNVELTDVVAFVEMPDGKVLSTTETGELLMWDGGLIKVRRPHDSSPCALPCALPSSIISNVLLRQLHHLILSALL